MASISISLILKLSVVILVIQEARAGGAIRANPDENLEPVLSFGLPVPSGAGSSRTRSCTMLMGVDGALDSVRGRSDGRGAGMLVTCGRGVESWVGLYDGD